MKKNRAIRKRISSLHFNARLHPPSGHGFLREEIKRRHDRYRELVEQSTEGIWRCELDEPVDIRLPGEQQIADMLERGHIAECNDAMARMYGFADQSELIGTRLNNLFVPDNENNRLFLQAFIENNYRLADVESIEQDKDGHVLYFRNNLIGIVKGHWLICAWGMQKDITQEVQTREGLRRSEERLRMASEAGSVGIWEWNVATNELFWSSHVKHIYGFPLDQEVSMDAFRAAIPPEDRELNDSRIADALKFPAKDHFSNEHRILVNGRIKWVQGFGETFFDDKGQPIRMSGTVIDITERKTAEINAALLRDASTCLSKAMTSKEVARVVVEFAIDNLQVQAVAVCRKYDEHLALQLLEARGYSSAQIDQLHDINANSPHPIAQAAFEGKTLTHDLPQSCCVLPLVLNQRILGAIELKYNQPQEFHKDFRQFVAAFADHCTQAFERARLYEMEQSARREAEAANQAKSRFLANMSHEIRTPLGAIIGFADLLNEGDMDDDERIDCVARILRNGHALADMINDILDLSKIESDKLELESLDFKLQTLVHDVLGLLQLKAQEKNLRLVLASMGNVPDFIHSDPTRLRQILINLISNAIKFTEQGCIEIRMKREQSEKGAPQVRFTITDTGIGIPLEQQSRIFEPFMQADSSTTRKFGGTGLGLAVSRRLAQALGGNLQLLQSTVGQGSQFSFTIDIGTTDNALQTFEEATPPQSNIHQFELAGLRILVVDDNLDNRTYISSFLSSAGATVETAINGLQAIDLATQREYDIVLMDIQMPKLDGIGAMQHLRSKSYTKPVLALTAHAMTGDRESSLNAGFHDHLVKPIDRASLIQAVGKYTSGPMKSG